jgi:hypothetical protein
MDVPVVVGSEGLVGWTWRLEMWEGRLGGLRNWKRGMADRGRAMVRESYGGRMVVCWRGGT